MKRFSTGLLLGILVGLLLSAATLTLADQPIRLVVNGIDITDRFEAKPMIVNDRTYVPARPLAEALGATVEWDGANNAVIVNAGKQTGKTPLDAPSSEIKETTFKGMEAIEKDGQIFFSAGDYFHIIFAKNNDNNILSDKQTQTYTIIINGTPTVIDLTNPENAQRYHERYYLNAKFYQSS